MIKANEFRIGNYVEFDSGLFQIDTISEELPTLKSSEFGIGVVDWNNIKPIKLSEEVLKNFGFEENPYQDRYEKDGIYIECIKVYGTTELRIDRYPHIKYAHQLQNFFYSVRQKELTFIDPPQDDINVDTSPQILDLTNVDGVERMISKNGLTWRVKKVVATINNRCIDNEGYSWSYFKPLEYTYLTLQDISDGKGTGIDPKVIKIKEVNNDEL